MTRALLLFALAAILVGCSSAPADTSTTVVNKKSDTVKSK